MLSGYMGLIRATRTSHLLFTPPLVGAREYFTSPRKRTAASSRRSFAGADTARVVAMPRLRRRWPGQCVGRVGDAEEGAWSSIKGEEVHRVKSHVTC